MYIRLRVNHPSSHRLRSSALECIVLPLITKCKSRNKVSCALVPECSQLEALSVAMCWILGFSQERCLTMKKPLCGSPRTGHYCEPKVKSNSFSRHLSDMETLPPDRRSRRPRRALRTQPANSAVSSAPTPRCPRKPHGLVFFFCSFLPSAELYKHSFVS